MSHFAKIDENNIVTTVMVADQSTINSGAFGDPSLWIETSFEHKFRKQYAGIGDTYDKTNDVFIRSNPANESWILDSNFDWIPPIPKPDGGGGYEWNEETQAWDVIPTRVDGEFVKMVHHSAE